jgi:GT2 family glycosyltransferase
MRMHDPIPATPRVSFVLTNFNYARYIERAIDSLLGQRDVDLELIVIDDCSTDASRTILQRYENEPRVRLLLHERNRGNIYSYNEGLALARGDIVGTFDADDVSLRPDVVARQVAMFDAHPEVGLVYTGFAIVDEADLPFRESKPWASDHVRPAYEAFTDLLSLNTVPHSGALVRRSCHDVVGWYDPRLSYAGDWDLWLRLAGRFAVGYLAGPLYAYRVHRNNMTSRGKPPGEATRERLQAVENAFAALPPDAPAAIREPRRDATRSSPGPGTTAPSGARAAAGSGSATRSGALPTYCCGGRSTARWPTWWSSRRSGTRGTNGSRRGGRAAAGDRSRHRPAPRVRARAARRRRPGHAAGGRTS